MLQQLSVRMLLLAICHESLMNVHFLHEAERQDSLSGGRKMVLFSVPATRELGDSVFDNLGRPGERRN